jgi:hypothetical protein
MDLKSKLQDELKRAVKGGDQEKSSLLRFILAQLHNREIEKQGRSENPSLSEEEIIDVLRKEYKKRKEAMDLFKRGGREDLFLKEEKEARFIEGYLPVQMGREAIAEVVRDLIKSEPRDFNALMREAMKKLKGQADGRLVGEVIKEQLGSS